MLCAARASVRLTGRRLPQGIPVLRALYPTTSFLTTPSLGPGFRLFSTDLRPQIPPRSPPPTPKDEGTEKGDKPTIHEDIYTIPNALTVSRILACPVLGWAILEGRYGLATGLLFYAGVTDWVRPHLIWVSVHY
jgi:hypothetical protein